MYDLLKWLAARYNDPIIMITENGGNYQMLLPPSMSVVDVPGETELPLSEALHDTFRVDYYSSYLSSVMKAMDEGVRVKGYFAWSLMVECITFLVTICRITSNGQMAMIIVLVYIMW